MKTFLTQRTVGDLVYAGRQIQALDFEQAVALCERRQQGQIVVGELFLTICSTGMTEKRADRIARAFAENGTIPEETGNGWRHD